MDSDANLQRWIVTFRRRKLQIFSLFAVLAALGATVVLLLPPRYAAEATIVVEPRKTQVTKYDPVVSNTPPEVMLGALRSELDVFKSVALTRRVVDELRLESNPLMRRGPIGTFVHEWIDRARAYVAELTGAEYAPPDPHLAFAQDVLTHLKADNDGRAYTIVLRYVAPDPDLAASIVNSYAKTYVHQRDAERDAMTKSAAGFLDAEIDRLRSEVQAADTEMQKFVAGHDLLEAKGMTIIAQQVSELNSQLTVASGDRAAKEAAYQQLEEMKKHGGQIVAGSPVLSSPLIQRLREQETTILQRQAELGAVYYPEAPQMQAVTAALADVRKKIAQEIGKIAEATRNDMLAARQRESELRDRVKGLEAKLAAVSADQVHLEQLQRQADSYHHAYEDLMARAQQVALDEGAARPDIKFQTAAAAPMYEAFPQKPVLLGLVLVAAFGLAFAYAHLRELRRPGFAMEVDLEAAGLRPLGVVGRLQSRHSFMYTEAMNAVATAIEGTAPKSILVTSAVRGEGKSVFSRSLAEAMANAGMRCLLLECDLRRPSLGEVMNVRSSGVETLLKQFRSPNELALQSMFGFDFVASNVADHPHAILQHAAFRAFLKQAEALYDCVILDAPPLVPVSDAVVLARLVAGTICVVKWEATPREVVVAALSSLAGSVILGAVLTQANLKRHALYRYGRRTYLKYRAYASV